MRRSDFISLKTIWEHQDENLDFCIEEKWFDIGKCTILPNGCGKQIKGNDGKSYTYSHEIIIRKPRYEFLIPREDETIHLHGQNGLIDDDFVVLGWGLIKHYIKIWV